MQDVLHINSRAQAIGDQDRQLCVSLRVRVFCTLAYRKTKRKATIVCVPWFDSLTPFQVYFHDVTCYDE